MTDFRILKYQEMISQLTKEVGDLRQENNLLRKQNIDILSSIEENRQYYDRKATNLYYT